MSLLLSPTLVLALALTAVASGGYVWEPLEAGPYAVGFRLVVQIDNTRPSLPPGKGTGRQVPIAIWYPAKSASNPKLRVRDYIIAAEQAVVGTVPGNESQVIEAFAKPHVTSQTQRADLERLLNAPVTGAMDAPPFDARFPLILFAHASPETGSVMCEYLASHGYVVAAVRSRGADDVTYKLSRENLDAMVADHEFVAARMRNDPHVLKGPIGVIGMSNGSIAAVALQLKGVNGAIVSLDGGIGENAGGTYLKERSSGDFSKLAAPILHLYAPNNPHLNLDHLRSYHASSRLLVFVRGMRHQDFLAYPMFDRIVPGFSGQGASADALSGFIWVNRYTLNFLDANLRNNVAAAKWLAAPPESHGAPEGLLTVERLKQSYQGSNVRRPRAVWEIAWRPARIAIPVI